MSSKVSHREDPIRFQCDQCIDTCGRQGPCLLFILTGAPCLFSIQPYCQSLLLGMFELFKYFLLQHDSCQDFIDHFEKWSATHGIPYIHRFFLRYCQFQAIRVLVFPSVNLAAWIAIQTTHDILVRQKEFLFLHTMFMALKIKYTDHSLLGLNLFEQSIRYAEKHPAVYFIVANPYHQFPQSKSLACFQLDYWVRVTF